MNALSATRRALIVEPNRSDLSKGSVDGSPKSTAGQTRPLAWLDQETPATSTAPEGSWQRSRNASRHSWSPGDAPRCV